MHPFHHGRLRAVFRGRLMKSKNYRLSMGSLFHSVTLQPDETITITKYQAKRSQKIENYAIAYRYVLQVPDGLAYYPVEITFMNRLVWAFNWSYLDNLVATQGVNESYEIVSVS
ncbi:unnamed protein product [Hydatigera taeniaeformis]|uniref:DUF3868 domain-containing protein n=1 Tax=Hydatigena taeniaeformis TaxID=6205 RepID=A0A0R3WM81_HYDTA|nr:unnamed protein product [Hydatigera taeniaeformis]